MENNVEIPPKTLKIEPPVICHPTSRRKRELKAVCFALFTGVLVTGARHGTYVSAQQE